MPVPDRLRPALRGIHRAVDAVVNGKLWWTPIAALTVLALVLTGVWFVQRRSATGAATVDQGTTQTATDSGATPVCGFAGSRIDQLVAVRPSSTVAPTLPHFEPSGSGDVDGIVAGSDSVVVSRHVSDSQTLLLRYSLDGKAEGQITVDASLGGRWTMGDDGSLYLLEAISGSTPVIAHIGRDGSKLGTIAIPSGLEPSKLGFPVWMSSYKGSSALLIGDGTSIAVLRADGRRDGSATIPGNVIGASGKDSVAVSATPSDRSARIDVLDASGSTLMRSVWSTVDPTQTDPTGAVPTPPGPVSQLRIVVTAPGGDGYLLVGGGGIQWVDRIGLQTGMLPSGQGSILTSASLTGMAERDGRYWMTVRANDSGTASVLMLTSAQMRERVREPFTDVTQAEQAVARLGIGIAPVTAQPFNHFDAGTAPAVSIAAESGWGVLPGSSRPDLELRYSVRGDPTLADPVVQSTRTAAIPWGGGQTPLSLPQSRPGPYEVDVSIVDRGSGAVVSGACLHYSIGSPSAPLRLASLASGDDWGGAGPLRGVQLAATLGIGSYRSQLNFSGLVPNPTAMPSASSVDWKALPGAVDGDPWSGLRQASAYATAHRVTMVVQVAGGGGTEGAAVTSNTWAAWVRVLVTAFAQNAPGITTWSGWNEPNNSSGLSPDDYWQKVEIPFADAVHATRPGATVIGGNTLGLPADWWQRAVSDGVCSHIDAVGSHPYTGRNRSWEEEGFAAAGAGWATLASSCPNLPRWDTETGWVGDGDLALWAQGSNVTSKLLWYRQYGIAGWTYFFSEGGFGESGLSWSLIQYRSFVKPGGLAFATVSRLLAGRGTPETVATDVPFTHVMRVPGDDTLVAAWTDAARIPARLSTDASSVSVTDEYGSTSALTPASGGAAVTLTAAPQFFRARAGASLTFAPTEKYGADLLKGRPVTASSTADGSAAASVITSGTANPPDLWRSGKAGTGIDPNPMVTVPLAQATTIDRIAVATDDVSCCSAGLRGYTVSVQKADGSWTVVAEPRNQFRDRTVIFRFDPVEATAVRVAARWTTIRGVKMLDANYTGYSGGLPPPFLGLETRSDNAMSVAAISAWAPGS